MDNQRLLIWAFFLLMGWMTWQTWQQDYGPQPAQPAQVQQDQQVGMPAEPAPTEALPELDASGDGVPAAPQVPGGSTAQTSAPVITVRTDVLDVQISTVGGTIQGATLLRYPVAKDRPDDLVKLLDTSGTDMAVIQSGLRAASGGAEATHLVNFSAPRSTYELGGADELVVPLTWRDASGVTVEKRFVFRRGSYRIDLEQAVSNGSGEAWKGAEYVRIRRNSHEVERSMFDVDTYSFDGPVVYDGEGSEKLKRKDLMEDGPVNVTAREGWLASIQHHFLRAAVPTPTEDYNYTVAIQNNIETSSTIRRNLVSVAAGGSALFETTLFVGPKLQDQLEEIDNSLKLTVDYGWLTILSNPMFFVLSFIYDFVGNWGVAIILVTLLIKLAFYKLTEASGRSMAKMRQIQPRMKALQDRYKDDRQALSQAMMDLYKREKVNPAAGCLPILIQMPFFLAFYWVLLESVEMRQAPFALWITDLSTRDPYFILPLIMGAAMLGQQKLNPAPTDPVQARVMQVMPVMFTVFFAFFPSGLVLYWVTNTLLSIAQQWKINRVVEAEAKAQKGGKKGSKKKE